MKSMTIQPYIYRSGIYRRNPVKEALLPSSLSARTGSSPVISPQSIHSLPDYQINDVVSRVV